MQKFHPDKNPTKEENKVDKALPKKKIKLKANNKTKSPNNDAKV